ncbi:DUF6515 family protein [Aquimarina sp. 2201CG5-10]|uniref:DUF6515 family protein n=1 Tax=Aquimarina callyspongiae TaxID=3098150 RepID=UPI002AB4FE03|nr:DUF6515 family protein [Aquimarina sp. 2201CG5-10]MDY8135914.1 DUF6515 family protein [Aquimarina sp. 2201CG5-10]
MKRVFRFIGIILIFMSFFGADSLQAQRSKGSKTQRTYSNKKSIGTKHYHDGRYRTQPIYRNPYYRYPRHHVVVTTLPRHHVHVVYRGLPYYYHAGIYYTVYNDGYIVVLPPVGFRIQTLPVGYTRIVVGPSIYFYHSGVYYTEVSKSSTEEEKYEITVPPVGTQVKEIHKDAEEAVIDGKIFYDYNNILYKKVSTFDGNTAYEVVFVNKEKE